MNTDEALELQTDPNAPKLSLYFGETDIDAKRSIIISDTLFNSIITDTLKSSKRYDMSQHMAQFTLSRDLSEQRHGLVILLAGTCGTGKSTLASLLADRMGIHTVISTDHIRHMLRDSVSKKQCPALFVSTYETHHTVEEDMPLKNKVVTGYKRQCAPVTEKLACVIDSFCKQNISVVIEGVHLRISFIVEMIKQFPCVVPFLVYISNEDKHRARFAMRTKTITLNPAENRYVAHFPNIRVIQKYLSKRAKEKLIPRIDNTNVDRSIAAIHSILLRCIRHIAAGRELFDAPTGQAVLMNEEFETTRALAWSSKEMKAIIREKVQKRELFQRLFRDGQGGGEGEGGARGEGGQAKIDEKELSVPLLPFTSPNASSSSCSAAAFSSSSSFSPARPPQLDVHSPPTIFALPAPIDCIDSGLFPSPPLASLPHIERKQSDTSKTMKDSIKRSKSEDNLTSLSSELAPLIVPPSTNKTRTRLANTPAAPTQSSSSSAATASVSALSSSSLSPLVIANDPHTPPLRAIHDHVFPPASLPSLASSSSSSSLSSSSSTSSSLSPSLSTSLPVTSSSALLASPVKNISMTTRTASTPSRTASIGNKSPAKPLNDKTTSGTHTTILAPTPSLLSEVVANHSNNHTYAEEEEAASLLPTSTISSLPQPLTVTTQTLALISPQKKRSGDLTPIPLIHTRNSPSKPLASTMPRHVQEPLSLEPSVDVSSQPVISPMISEDFMLVATHSESQSDSLTSSLHTTTSIIAPLVEVTSAPPLLSSSSSQQSVTSTEPISQSTVSLSPKASATHHHHHKIDNKKVTFQTKPPRNPASFRTSLSGSPSSTTMPIVPQRSTERRKGRSSSASSSLPSTPTGMNSTISIINKSPETVETKTDDQAVDDQAAAAAVAVVPPLKPAGHTSSLGSRLLTVIMRPYTSSRRNSSSKTQPNTSSLSSTKESGVLKHRRFSARTESDPKVTDSPDKSFVVETPSAVGEVADVSTVSSSSTSVVSSSVSGRPRLGRSSSGRRSSLGSSMNDLYSKSISSMKLSSPEQGVSSEQPLSNDTASNNVANGSHPSSPFTSLKTGSPHSSKTRSSRDDSHDGNSTTSRPVRHETKSSRTRTGSSRDRPERRTRSSSHGKRAPRASTSSPALNHSFSSPPKHMLNMVDKSEVPESDVATVETKEVDQVNTSSRGRSRGHEQKVGRVLLLIGKTSSSPPSSPSPRSGDSDSSVASLSHLYSRSKGGASTSESEGEDTPRPLKPLARPQSGSDTEPDEEDESSETEPSTANTGSHSDQSRSGNEFHSEEDTSDGESGPDSEQRDRIDCVSAPSVMAPPSVHSLVISESGEDDRRSLDSTALSHFDRFEAVIVPGPGSTSQSSESLDKMFDGSPMRQPDTSSPRSPLYEFQALSPLRSGMSEQLGAIHETSTHVGKPTMMRPPLLRASTFDSSAAKLRHHHDNTVFYESPRANDDVHARSPTARLEGSSQTIVNQEDTHEPLHLPHRRHSDPRLHPRQRPSTLKSPSSSLAQRHSPINLQSVAPGS